MKILVSAYACEPNKGSEPGIGWNWVRQTARFHEVWVITRANNRNIIIEELNKNPIANLYFHYLDLPRWTCFWKKGSRGLHLYYYLWQIASYFAAKKLNKKIKFDLAHHVTFASDWMPSFLSFLPIPFIWGPLGSHAPLPKVFLKYFGIRPFCREISRLFFKKLFRSFDPFTRHTMNKSKKIIIIDTKQIRRIPKRLQAKTMTFSNIGINLNELPKNSLSKYKDFPIILSAARLVYFKGFRLSIESFALFLKIFPNYKLIIVGDGPEKAILEMIARKRNIINEIVMTGRLPRTEVLKYIISCDIFLYPSFAAGDLVVPEVLAAGKPIICLDFGGPGEMVTNECGIKIKAKSPRQVINDLAKALELLASDEQLRKNLGEGARRRAEEVFNWDIKGEQINRIYQKIINGL